MPAGMFSIDSILSARPSCKEPLLLHRSGPVVLSAGLTDSLYTDYNGLYSATCGPSGPGVQSVNGTRLGYNGYYYGQLHVQGAGGGPPCCGSVAGLSAQQCPCIPTGRTRTTHTHLPPQFSVFSGGKRFGERYDPQNHCRRRMCEKRNRCDQLLYYLYYPEPSYRHKPSHQTLTLCSCAAQVWFKNRRAKWRRQKRSSSEESENSQKWSKAPKTAAAAAAAEKPEESKSDVESDS
uniref:Homeobox domain-containing protein n=1 Tax=Stegastes partitus TaxID=144197 RepID=A0A3B5ATF0_9TELE